VKNLFKKLGPYRTGPVYCEKSRDRVGSQHYYGHHPGGEDYPMLYKLSDMLTLLPFVVNSDYTYNDVTENKMESD
jgi:hypothetical protein